MPFPTLFVKKGLGASPEPFLPLLRLSFLVLWVLLLSCRDEYPEAVLRNENKLPVIEDFRPKEAKRGEEVTLTGKNFSEGTPNVRIGSTYATVLFFDKTTLRFAVPVDVADALYTIEVYNIHGLGTTEGTINVLRE